MAELSIFDIGLNQNELNYKSVENNFSVSVSQIENNIFRVVLEGFLNFEANLYYTGILENILLKFKNYDALEKVYFIEHASNLSGFSFDSKPYTEKKILEWSNLGSIKILGANHLYRAYIEMIQKAIPKNIIDFGNDERDLLLKLKHSLKKPAFEQSTVPRNKTKTKETNGQIKSDPWNFEKVQQAEWQLTTADKHFASDFAIVEDKVILSKASGYVQKADIVKFLDFNNKLAQFFELDDQEYQEILDLSEIHGMTNPVKRIVKTLFLQHGDKIDKLIIVSPSPIIANTLNILKTLFPDKLAYCEITSSLNAAFSSLGIQPKAIKKEAPATQISNELLEKKQEELKKLSEAFASSNSLHTARIQQLEDVIQHLHANKTAPELDFKLTNDDPYNNLFEAIFKLKELFDSSSELSSNSEWRNHIDYLREIINLSDDGIMVIANSKIQYINQKVLTLSGKTSDQLLMNNMDILFSGDDLARLHDLIQKISETGPLYDRFDLSMYNGQAYQMVSVRLATIIYKDQLATLLFIKEPIKEQKAATTGSAEQLSNEESHKLAMLQEKLYDTEQFKNSLLANLSHEIRTPMTAIVGLAEFLSNPVDQQATEEYVKLIKLNANNLLSLINDLIDISKLESHLIKPAKEQINTHKLLNDLYEDYIAYQEINDRSTIEFKLVNKTSEQPLLMNDYDRLKQIMSHLLRNAFKYTSAGTVEYGIEKISSENISFYVADTGIGIPESKKKIVFEAFRQANEGYVKEFGGLGLGLSIVKQLTELLGGSISFESEINKGTKFTINFPLTQKTEQQTKQVHKPKRSVDIIPDRSEIGILNNARILIVEDIEPSYILLNSMLKKTGATVLWAKDGQEAIDICTQQKIDLVLMDIRMPAVNGLEATQKIKLFKPQLPVIAQTAYTQEEDRVKIFGSGCDDYISKPIERDLLFEKIEHLLNKDLPFTTHN